MRWGAFLLGWLLVLGGGFLAHSIQTSGGITVEDVRFDRGDGSEMSALLYRPQGASEEAPAPAILATHGYINSRETQSGFAIEYARRGYVVLAIDQTGHGFSDPPAFALGFGGPPGLAYLRDLPFVDPDRIGLEGHSMGGWASLAAAATMPDAYRSIALIGSSTGAPFAAEGAPEFPRNAAVIFSLYDEFAPFMWETPDSRHIGRSAKLQALFGVGETVEPGRLYGSIEAGTARWLVTPAVTHPGDHISHAAIGEAMAWMNLTLENDTPLADGDQIWLWKEIGTLIALIGGVVLLFGSIELLLSLPLFASLRQPVEPTAPNRTRGWWIGLALAALVPALTYFPLELLGMLFANIALFPQNLTNQILTWAIGNALIALFVGGRLGAFRESQMARKAALALAAVAIVYLAVALSGVLFLTDLRFWVVALKPLADHHWWIFLVYFIPFTAFFWLSQRVLLGRIATGPVGYGQYGWAILATVGGLALLLIVIYAWLFATGHVPPLTDPLFAIVLIQFVPVLAVTAAIAVFAWRRTGGPAAGAMICGLLITWYVVAGQATHV